MYAEFAGLTNKLDGFYKVLTLNVGTASSQYVLLGITNANNLYASIGGTFISSVAPSDISIKVICICNS